MIKQGLRSAISTISNVYYALKPLRDLQLAAKLSGINLDMEEEETQKDIALYNRMMKGR